MTKKLISFNTHQPFVLAVRVLWSSCWKTRTPWQNAPYVGVSKETHGNMILRILYLGPLALIAGTMM